MIEEIIARAVRSFISEQGWSIIDLRERYSLNLSEQDKHSGIMWAQRLIDESGGTGTLIEEISASKYPAMAAYFVLGVAESVSAKPRAAKPSNGIKASMSRRKAIFEKTGGRCAYCGKILDPFVGWHIEHIVPRSNGGNNDDTNLFASCVSCNSSKKSYSLDEWRAKLPQLMIDELVRTRTKLKRFLDYNATLPSSTLQQLLDNLLEAQPKISDIEIKFYFERMESIDE